MVTYSMLDADLNRWAKKLGTPWSRIYKDEEIRSLEVDVGLSRKVQIWVEFSDDGTHLDVKAWDKKKRLFSETASPSQLCEALDRALYQANIWQDSEPNS